VRSVVSTEADQLYFYRPQGDQLLSLSVAVPRFKIIDLVNFVLARVIGNVSCQFGFGV